MKKKRYSEEQIIKAIKENEVGVKIDDICRNQHWFRTLEKAGWEIDRWREHYNNVRPHSLLGYLPPVEFAKRAA